MICRNNFPLYSTRKPVASVECPSYFQQPEEDMAGIVIIGAGQGAGQAAASLRQQGYEGTVTILGDEAFPPYPVSYTHLTLPTSDLV